MRILYLGTPEFAVAPLKKLVEHNYEIVSVVTATDKPAGRGNQLQQSAVKQYAIANKIPVLQPEKLRDEKFIEHLRSLQIDLGIVVAFRMMPEILWSLPRMGTFNLHASLLPQYRGAAPIHWAVINGENETGVTTFFLQHEIDTGEIILQDKVPISEQDTTGILYEKLMHVGADLVLKTVQRIEQGNRHTVPQHTAEILLTASKIYKEMAEINFAKTVEEVYNLVRGMHPYPCAFAKINNKVYKIHAVKKEIISHSEAIGNLTTDNKTYVKVACSNGFVHLITVQAEGKKVMQIEDFLRGNRF